MCDTCGSSNCSSRLTGDIKYDGSEFVCTVDTVEQFNIQPGDYLNAILNILFTQTCTILTGIDSGSLTGAAWLNGTGAPSSGLGNDGDYYLETVTGDVYSKTSGTWAIVANIKGATGATGATGVSGGVGADGLSFRFGTGIPSSGLGNDGDTYIDLASPDIDVYTKSGGSWTDTTLNLKGATGATGAAGTNGTDGDDGFNFIQGNGVPSGGLGNDGDTYLNNSNGDIYLKVTGSWSLTGNIYTGSITGLEHLFNAGKIVEQTLTANIALPTELLLAFADDNVGAGRFDYGNNWITDTWTSPGVLADVNTKALISVEINDAHAANDDEIDIEFYKNAVAIGSGTLIIPGGTPNGTIFNFLSESGVEAFASGDLVQVKIKAPASDAPFTAKVLVGSYAYNVQE